MGLPAARITDKTMHGGMIVIGKINVLIGGLPAARLGDTHLCPPGHWTGPILPACAWNVLIGGRPAARITDKLVCGCAVPDVIVTGKMNVLIGTSSGTSAGPGGVAVPDATTQEIDLTQIGPPPPPPAAQLFPVGTIVHVVRSSGAVESGWTVVSTSGDRVTVQKGPLQKTVPAADLLRENPQLLQGRDLQVKRSSGLMDAGWQLISSTAGQALVAKAGIGHKTVPFADLLSWNNLTGSKPAPPAHAPIGGPASVTPNSAAAIQSDKFRRQSFIPPGERIEDGYLDGGRGMSIGPDGRVTASREVFYVDRQRDVQLQQDLAYARSLRSLPEKQRAQELIKYVDQRMNPAAGRHVSDQAVNQWSGPLANQAVPLGEVGSLGGGVCRHRSVMYKVLGDEAGLNVGLRRGFMATPMGPGAHAWNEVRYSDGSTGIADVMNPERDFSLPASRSRSGMYMDAARQPLYS